MRLQLFAELIIDWGEAFLSSCWLFKWLSWPVISLAKNLSTLWRIQSFVGMPIDWITVSNNMCCELVSDNSSILSSSGESLSHQSSDLTAQRSGQKHCISDDNIVTQPRSAFEQHHVHKKSRTTDIEDCSSGAAVVAAAATSDSLRYRSSGAALITLSSSMEYSASAKTDVSDNLLPSSCPGFFPGCGSLVPCDECSDKNRLLVLMNSDHDS